MGLTSDMTTDMMGPITTPASSQSEGPGGVTNLPVANTTSPQPPGMEPHTTNPITSPFLHPLGEPSVGQTLGGGC